MHRNFQDSKGKLEKANLQVFIMCFSRGFNLGHCKTKLTMHHWKLTWNLKSPYWKGTSSSKSRFWGSMLVFGGLISANYQDCSPAKPRLWRHPAGLEARQLTTSSHSLWRPVTARTLFHVWKVTKSSKYCSYLQLKITLAVGYDKLSMCNQFMWGVILVSVTVFSSHRQITTQLSSANLKCLQNI